MNIFEEVVRINLVGTFNVCRLVAAHIIANIKADAEKEGNRGYLFFSLFDSDWNSLSIP